MSLDPHLRLRHIRCFLEIAASGSLTDAAGHLNISQPAASKTLKELERILGRQLFDRQGRRVRLNENGHLFQQHAGVALTELIRAQDAVRKTRAEAVRLSVGALPTVAATLLPSAALGFREEMPHVTIHVLTGPNWLLLSQLRDGRVDLVVGRMAGPEEMTGLAFAQLYSENVVLAVRPGHPILGADDVAARLRDYPMILPPRGAVISEIVRRFLTSIGLRTVRPAFETVSLPFGRKIVSGTDTIWFISRGVVADEIDRGHLRAVDLGSTLLAGPVGISFREDAVPNVARSTLVAHLKRAARDEADRAPRG